jgi:bacterioferritin (cytochrome b1)
MGDLAPKLNEILANEWACVRALRRAESHCDEHGKLEVIKRVRRDCSVNCVNLAGIVRGLGGRPTDVPSARFSLKLTDELLSDGLDLAQSAQEHILAEIDTLIDEPDLKTYRELLLTIRKLHTEDIHWLKSAMQSSG